MNELTSVRCLLVRREVRRHVYLHQKSFDKMRVVLPIIFLFVVYVVEVNANQSEECHIVHNYMYMRTYKKGERYAKKCLSCICNGHDKPYGCRSLCTPPVAKCKKGEVLSYMLKKRAPHCDCIEAVCLNKDQCVVGHALLTKGETFHKKCDRCTCAGNNKYNQCVSICPSTDGKCNKNQVIRYETVQRTRDCYCTEKVCLAKKLAGTSYDRRRFFTDIGDIGDL